MESVQIFDERPFHTQPSNWSVSSDSTEELPRLPRQKSAEMIGLIPPNSNQNGVWQNGLSKVFKKFGRLYRQIRFWSRKTETPKKRSNIKLKIRGRSKTM